jgi:gliding motility-associated-like protein
VPPVFIETLPVDENTCDVITPSAILTAIDNCGNALVTYSEVIDSITEINTTIYIRTWTAKDECQNTSVHQQTIRVSDVVIINIDSTVCEGNSVVIGANSYNTTGVYQNTFISANGCDSVVTLNLIVKPIQRTNIDTVICKGDSIIVGGQIFNTNVINHVIMVPSSLGCDSIITLNIVILNQDTIITNRTICNGDSVIVNGQTFTTAGTYYLPFQNDQCVGIVQLNLTVNQPTVSNISRTICEGDSVIIEGQVFSSNGNHNITTQNSNGCDSIITLNLNVIPKQSVSIAKTICNGEGYMVGTNMYYASGIYVVGLKNSNGCDSIVTLNLIVLKTDTILINETICQKEKVVIAGQTFNATGKYLIKLRNSLGCDSIIILDLNVKFCEITTPVIRDTIVYDTLPVDDIKTICNFTTTHLDDMEIKSCDGSVIGTTTLGGSWIIDSLGCLVYSSGPTKGNDTLCIRACINGTDTCATSTIIITVTGLPPTAVSDSINTYSNTPIDIPVLNNDTTYDEDSLQLCDADPIVTSPGHGTLVINDNGTITYIPVTGYTGLDSFQYQICDREGRDTAWVYILVKGACDIPNAISPNGDGINDIFIVPCADGDIVFSAYNRWGIEVYRSDRYLNDWDGRYKGSPLPDGTYYYVLQFTTETGEKVNRAGFITIHR